MLADLARRLRFEPDDVGYILPVRGGRRGARPRRRARPRPADDRARLDRRHRRPHEGLRPRVPPHQPAAAGALAADRRGAAARRVVPADLRLPDRRAALRARRAPPRLGRALARAQGHRRLRHRGADARRRRPRRAHLRPAGQGPRAAVPRARPARRPRAASASSPPTRGTTGCSPRASRPGAFARCRAAAVHGPRRGRRGCGSTRTTSRSPRCCDEAELVERGETETDAYMRVVTARYLLLRTHEWSDEVLERLRSAQRDRSARGCRRSGATASGRLLARGAPGPAPGRGAHCVLARDRVGRVLRREAAAALGVEELDLGGVERRARPPCRRRPRSRREPRDDVLRRRRPRRAARRGRRPRRARRAPRTPRPAPRRRSRRRAPSPSTRRRRPWSRTSCRRSGARRRPRRPRSARGGCPRSRRAGRRP